MSTRPSHDNVINSLGVNMAAALDQIMTVQGQSYDEFLEGFTYLNKDELKKEMITPASKMRERPQLSKMKELEEKDESLTKSLAMNSSKSADEKEPNYDELEEELLEDGERTSIMSQKSPTGSDVTSRLKFDNFVMDEISDHGESDDAEDFISGGYQASFCPESSSESAIEGNSMEERTPDLDEQNVDIDNLLQDNSDKLQVRNIPVKFGKTGFQINSADHEGVRSSEKTVSLIDSNSSASELDPQGECAQCSEQLSSEDRVRAPPSDTVLNPGEVEDPGSPKVIKVKDKERILDFSATYRTEVVVTEESTEECSDEVAAFCLDEDFDYDNVVLTPKFTTEEIEFLKSCRT
ncbi:uncharacterized protein LOC125647912 isoform X2 [Ostrea edulis]|uniref:uncharacterized protein LOC125647912 isoform X2 n=1 Tax=Ostrea edulis TaxID=37623 RepID=UPI00209405CC|nr:uncharacterized protein LOC125647912 isoform X2 [Ostrea edulis]XP_055996213.1 uncharacterized protein LOC125647912 isoform X2 [Ostrea edulis]